MNFNKNTGIQHPPCRGDRGSTGHNVQEFGKLLYARYLKADDEVVGLRKRLTLQDDSTFNCLLLTVFNITPIYTPAIRLLMKFRRADQSDGWNVIPELKNEETPFGLSFVQCLSPELVGKPSSAWIFMSLGFADLDYANLMKFQKQTDEALLAGAIK